MVLDHAEVLRAFEDMDGRMQSMFEVHARFQSMFQYAPIAICLVAPTGEFIEVNPACERVWGRTREELLATTWMAITHEDDIDGDGQKVQDVIAGTIPYYAMYKRYRLPDYTIVPALLHVSAVKDQKGNLLYFVSQIQAIKECERVIKEYYKRFHARRF